MGSDLWMYEKTRVGHKILFFFKLIINSICFDIEEHFYNFNISFHPSTHEDDCEYKGKMPPMVLHAGNLYLPNSFLHHMKIVKIYEFRFQQQKMRLFIHIGASSGIYILLALASFFVLSSIYYYIVLLKRGVWE